MNEQLHIIAEVLLNYNSEPCIHFNELFLPLYLTCKTLYNKFVSEKRQVFDCDICHFREIICYKCKKNNTKSCKNCKCKICCISINLTGGFINLNDICNRCPKPKIVLLEYAFALHPMIMSIHALEHWERIVQVQFENKFNRLNIRSKNFNLDFDGDEENAFLPNIENIFQHRTEEVVVKSIKTPNFKSTKYFENKKTKNIKNNYKHNGQQFRRQNQLKQPR